MNNKVDPNIICVLGPTASGKTTFAANLSARVNGEIVSADSRQVYRHMNIGTGKDLKEYVVGGEEIPFHLIDIVEPGYEYNVFEYQKDFLKIYHDIRNRGKIPVLCGGTGMYIEAVLKAYKLINVPPNPSLRKKLESQSHEDLIKEFSAYREPHNTTDTGNIKRLIRAIEIEEFYSRNPEKSLEFPMLSSIILGISFDRETRRDRITERLHERLKNGMVEETKQLLEMGIPEKKLIYYGLEYKYLTWYLSDKISYKEMVDRLNSAIHQFAKRQMTWFRRMERRGFNIYWIKGELPLEEKLNLSLQIIKNFRIEKENNE